MNHKSRRLPFMFRNVMNANQASLYGAKNSMDYRKRGIDNVKA
jgi:hypothetical protein